LLREKLRFLKRRNQMAQPPEKEPSEELGTWYRHEVRRRRHKHSLKRRLFRFVVLPVLGLAALVLTYYLLGWISDSTYTLDHIFR